jgi:hypothetical protein
MSLSFFIPYIPPAASKADNPPSMGVAGGAPGCAKTIIVVKRNVNVKINLELILLRFGLHNFRRDE